MDRIRTNVSIGYQVNDYVQEEPGKRTEKPVFRVTDWTLLEVPSVSIPSDFGMGAFAQLIQNHLITGIQRCKIQ